MASDCDADWPPEMVSLCERCAKHPELKSLVESDLANGVCGICGTSAGKVFNPKRFSEARNLIRALIRLYFNEEDYNPHWGGTSIGNVLLDAQNPIVETTKSDCYVDDFIERIIWEGGVYPEPEDGIWLYAGHHPDIGRLLQSSIPESVPGELRDIQSRLKRENFHAVESAMEQLVLKMEADIADEILENSLWYRSRIGVAEADMHIEGREVIRVATPYKGTEIGPLLPADAAPGRTNRHGVSVLYLASEADTALAEVRPHPGHMISLGGFRAQRKLRVARFDLPIGNFCSSEHRLEAYSLIFHVDSLLSLPIIPEERYRYAVTQLLADVLIRRGFEGVIYRSSVGKGQNLCVFKPDAFAFDERASDVKQVERLDYKFADISTVVPTE
jgi:hypothetical protein